MSEEDPEDNNTKEKTWWKKHERGILVWTSLGSFILSFLQLLIKFLKK